MIERQDIGTWNPCGGRLATRLLNNGGGVKAVSLAIPPGGEPADHTAPGPAMRLAPEGDARFIAGAGEIRLLPGTLVHIAPGVCASRRRRKEQPASARALNPARS